MKRKTPLEIRREIDKKFEGKTAEEIKEILKQDTAEYIKKHKKLREKSELRKKHREMCGDRGRQFFKAPKLRFKPGWFVRENKSGQLYCILLAYRYKEDDANWIFILEERKNLGNPQTTLSKLCEAAGGTSEVSRIIWEPLHRGDALSLASNIYGHGDRCHVPNKKLINDFEVISHGEVEK